MREYFSRFGYVMDVYLPKSKDNKVRVCADGIDSIRQRQVQVPALESNAPAHCMTGTSILVHARIAHTGH